MYAAFASVPPPHPAAVTARAGMSKAKLRKRTSPTLTRYQAATGTVMVGRARDSGGIGGKSVEGWEAWHFGFIGGPPPCSEAGNAVTGAGEEEGLARTSGVPSFVPGPYRVPLLRS